MNNEEEIWKDIEGFEGVYQVSNFGRVRRWKYFKKYWRQVKPINHKRNYKRVCLMKKGVKRRLYSVHRLVAKAFVPIPQELLDQGYTYDTLQVNHIDENPSNNYYKNLEWCTSQYNNTYGSHIERLAKTLSIPVTQFDLEGNWMKNWPSATEAERALQYSDDWNITSACKGLITTAAGFLWRHTKPEYGPGYKLNIEEIETAYTKCKKVSQFDLEGNYIKTYLSPAVCSKILNIDVGSICASCTGKYRYAYGYIFRYYKPEYKKGYNLFDIDLNEINDKFIGRYDLKTGELLQIYSNIHDAYRDYKKNYKGINGWQMIYHCCKGLIRQAYGYGWKFLNKQ